MLILKGRPLIPASEQRIVKAKWYT